MNEVTLKDVLDVVIDVKTEQKKMKQDLEQKMNEMKQDLKQEMNEMKQDLEQEMDEMKQDLEQEMDEMKQDLEQEMDEMKQDINKNLEQIEKTQKQVLKLQEDVSVEIKWVVKRIGEDEIKTNYLERDMQKYLKRNKGKIIEFKGKKE